MIDFRYHIVSIVAVFLALALGLVLGTTTIDPIVVGDLKNRVTQLVNDKRGLQGDVETLRQQAADGTAFARAATGPLVMDQLTSRGVVVLSLPGTPAAMRDGLLDLLARAGAHISARVSLTGTYADPADSALLDATVSASTPAGTVLSGTTPAQRSAELLAAVLSRPTTLPGGASPLPVATGPAATGPAATGPAGTGPAGTGPAGTGPAATRTRGSTPPVADTQTATPDGALVDQTVTVLAAYASAGFLSVDADRPSPSDLVLVLTPDGPADGQPPAGGVYDSYVDLIGALVGGRHASVVVAGPVNSVAKGVVDFVRRSGVDPRVSTVDGAETPAGAVATIRALRAQLFGRSGRYGVAAGDGALPTGDAQ